MNDVQRFGRIQVEMCDTFKSKNADYGNSFSQLLAITASSPPPSRSPISTTAS